MKAANIGKVIAESNSSHFIGMSVVAEFVAGMQGRRGMKPHMFLEHKLVE